MAMTIMAIGASAVMSMQKASVQGNFDARETDIANSIARTWVERLRRDAMQWTGIGPNVPTDNLAGALVVQAGVNNPGKWFLPSQYVGLTQPVSPGFDILGRDLPLASLLPTNGVPGALFCVHVRIQPLDPAGAQALLRADVRVLWARGITSTFVPSAPTAVCDPSVATADTPNPLAYHAIYVTTAIKGNPQ
jgi:hypothetical protein